MHGFGMDKLLAMMVKHAYLVYDVEVILQSFRGHVPEVLVQDVDKRLQECKRI